MTHHPAVGGARTPDVRKHEGSHRGVGNVIRVSPELISVPLSEAGRLESLFRVLQVDPAREQHSSDFAEMLRDAWEATQPFESALERDGPNAELSQKLRVVNDSCKICHEVYRNQRYGNPRTRRTAAE